MPTNYVRKREEANAQFERKAMTARLQSTLKEIEDAVLTEMNRRNVDTETYLKAEMAFASVQTMVGEFIGKQKV